MPSVDYVDTQIHRGLVERRYSSGKIVYRYRVWLREYTHPETGKLVKPSKSGTWEGITRTEAKKFFRDLEHDRDEGKVTVEKRTLFAIKDAAYDLFEEDGILGEGTRVNYDTHWKKRISLWPIAHLRLDQIDKHAVKDFLRELRKLWGGTSPTISTNTANGCVSALRTVLRYAREEKEWINSDPFANVPRDLFPPQKPNPNYVKRVLSVNETIKFRDAIASDEFAARSRAAIYTDVVTILLFTGMRVSELVGLRWRDVDFKTGKVAISGQMARALKKDDAHFTVAPKNGDDGIRSPRFLKLLEIEEAFTFRLEHEREKGLGRADDFCFTDYEGLPISAPVASDAVRRAMVIAGLGNFSAKALRGSFVTAGVRANIPAAELRGWTGHSVDTLINHYVRPLEDEETESENFGKLAAYGLGTVTAV